MHDIALIVVNYKMAEYIRELLRTVAYELSVTTLDFKIIIVDNESDDHIDEVVAQSILERTITLIKEKKNRGMAAGVNVGLASIRANYYFIINPDIVFFEPATIFRLFQWMEAHPKVAMVGPKLLNSDGSLQYSCWKFPPMLTPLYRRTRFGNTRRGKKALAFFHMTDWDHERTQPVDCIMGSAMLVRDSALEKIGPMNDFYFMYFEDIDWCRRFWMKHLPVYYIHDVRITHHHQRDSAKVGGLKALFVNRMTRVHVISWLKYLWVWRGSFLRLR